jgi:hypothetical protein
MTKEKEKKEEKPRYETPVVVRLDQVDKASGLGDQCRTGSTPSDCIAGGNASLLCVSGSVAH